jgi:hypothetical protein
MTRRFKTFVEENPTATLADGAAAKFAMIEDGENVEATLDAVAASDAFAAQYGAVISLTAGAMHSVVGSPSLSSTASFRHSAWLMDQTADEAIAGRVHIPSGWATFNVDVLWANAGAGSGAVVFNTNLVKVAPGATINAAGTSPGTVTATAGAQDVLVRTTVITATATVADALNGLRLYRIGSNVADTVANDIAILAVEFVRVS